MDRTVLGEDIHPTAPQGSSNTANPSAPQAPTLRQTHCVGPALQDPEKAIRYTMAQRELRAQETAEG